MHRKGLSLFQQIQNREINGNTVNTNQFKSQHEAKACALIIKFNKENNLVIKLSYLSELKRFAILGVDSALNYFNMPLFKSFDSVELNDAFNLACEEIGYATLNPVLLYNAYCRFSCFDEYNMERNFPRIQKSIDSLLSAAKMEGKDATKASYILAYLYSSELGYHFQDKRPLMLASISYLHNQFSTPLGRLSANEKQTYWRRKNIDCDQLRLEGEITFARLGCKKAIENLIEWYENGNHSLHIDINMDKAKEWKKRSSELQDFLTAKYFEYYALALQNTKKFGYVSVGDPNVDIEYFIDAWCQIKFGHDQERKASTHLEINKEFIQEAESGNIATCLFLGQAALKIKNLNEAKLWFNKILEINPVRVKPAPEALLAARMCYELSIKENAESNIQNMLLEKAANLGCVFSLLDLGKMKLHANDFDNAKKFFNLALAQSSLTRTAYMICDYLLSAKENYTLEIIEPYYISIKGEEIKRGSISGIEDLMMVAQQAKNDELLSSWNAVYQARRHGYGVDPNKIDQLIEKTQAFFAEYGSYSLEPRISIIRLSS